MGRYDVCSALFLPGLSIEITRACFNTREVMNQEDNVENLDQEVYRSLWEMLQGPVRRARSFDDFETPVGFLNLLRVG